MANSFLKIPIESLSFLVLLPRSMDLKAKLAVPGGIGMVFLGLTWQLNDDLTAVYLVVELC